MVYAGVWTKNDGKKVRVAMKTLFDPSVDAELKREFMDELVVMAPLRHENILRIYGACVTPPNMFMCLEMMDRSLSGLLHQSVRNQGFAKALVPLRPT